MVTGGDRVAVYADESCIGNGREGENPGGAAGVVEWLSPRTRLVRRFDYWISEPATTNNRMALRSAIEALRALGGKGNRLHVDFHSDSRYIVDGVTRWLPRWKAQSWRRKTGEILNLELWRALDVELAAHDVHLHWVAGHAGHPQNEYANFLAMRAATEQTSSKGLQPSEFDRWLAAQRERGMKLTDVAAFPGSAARTTKLS